MAQWGARCLRNSAFGHDHVAGYDLQYDPSCGGFVRRVKDLQGRVSSVRAEIVPRSLSAVVSGICFLRTRGDRPLLISHCKMVG